MTTIEKIFFRISSNWTKIKPFVPKFVINSGINFLIWYSDQLDKKLYKKTGCVKFPTAKLRYKVHGNPFIESYMSMGKAQKKDLEFCLSKINKNIPSFQNVLDFGCGCGRTIVAFEDNDISKFFGTDIDEEAIRWCQDNLKFASFDINQLLPPTKYESNKFDFIYAISIFTHLNEELQFLWLDELKRITKPNGILLLTLHNIELLKTQITKKENVSTLTQTGFVHLKRQFLQRDFPEEYQNTYHSKEYVMENYSKYFKILQYIPKGINNFQDVVLLENN